MRGHRCLAGCGKAITYRFAICSDCEKIYGRSSLQWPEWLRYSWKQTQKDRRKEKKHKQNCINITFNDI